MQHTKALFGLILEPVTTQNYMGADVLRQVCALHSFLTKVAMSALAFVDKVAQHACKQEDACAIQQSFCNYPCSVHLLESGH